MATSRKFDKLYKAIGKGERTSKKFATIRMTDGTSFKRRNANQYYPDGVPGDEDYTEKRVNRTDKYTKDGKVIAKVGANIGNRRMDKMYKAIGKGERTSKKFATIRMTDGTTFKRRNANQFYPDGVPGDEDYTEKRVNRTDKYTKDGKVIAKKGTTIPSTKKKKKTTKPKEPMIVRTQFEEENYEYGNGGTMPCCYTIGGL
jgi:hypothetical protein